MDQHYGLIGEHLGHSYSPILQAYYGVEHYKLMETSEDELEGYLADTSYSGFNVTIPYKKTIMSYCHTLSTVAREVGAVNTIIRQEDGTWYGTNTDVDGFQYLLDGLSIDVVGKEVLVLGSGGASAAVCYVLRRSGALPIVVSRIGQVNYKNVELYNKSVLLVNTTPVGMYPNNDEIPINLERLGNIHGIIDVIYNPLDTRLITEGKLRNLKCIGGLGMLVAQGRAAAELFLHQSIALERIEQVEKELLKNIQNIVLIGMPGCGKTTIGRQMSIQFNRPFVDIDEEIEKKTGRTVDEIIRIDGEQVFRKLETSTIREVTKKTGQVIATGGGVVTRTENYPLLVQNGMIYYVKRSLSKMSIAGRPLSQIVGLEVLYEQRKSLYQSWSSQTIINK